MAGRLVVRMRRSISTSATSDLPPLVGAQYTRFLPCKVAVHQEPAMGRNGQTAHVLKGSECCERGAARGLPAAQQLPQGG